MISIKGNNANYEGTSADTKPSGVPVNTIFRELDTNCYYYYTGEAWVEIPGGGGGGGGGTDSYNDLENKPQINSVTLSGNKTLSALGIQAELTIDSAPTEDSTNPVESGGVYEALALKQDTLTIDSAPTESSTNPVESGGVYSALADKQDTLTFEGTYNASTNKAATESTVSDAISTAVGNLTKSDVGLSNVTNNEQIKAVSGGVTSGDIVTFGADGATVQDSGKAIETTLTDSNDKLPTSKSIIDNAAGAAKLTGYTTDSSEQTIGATTKITDAIEQLDYRTATNKTNILLNENEGFLQKNLTSWTGGTTSTDGSFVGGIQQLSLPAGTYTISFETTATTGRCSVDFLDDSASVGTVNFDNTTGRISGNITIPSAATRFRFYTLKACTVTNFQITKAGEDTSYTPYALSNAELTSLEKQNENNILLLENYGGGINKLDCSLSKLKSLNSSSWTWNGNVATIGSQTITVNSDKTLTVHTTNEHGQLSFMLTTLATNQGSLFVSGCPSGGNASTYKIGISNVGYDTGDGKAVPNQTTARQVFIEISANVAIDLTFKPMIIEQSIHDNGFNGFQPYAMTNVELTEQKFNRNVANSSKTYTLENNNQYIITVNSYGTLDHTTSTL